MSFTRIKVCCIGSEEEAKLAIEMGVSAIGLVGPNSRGDGVIPDRLARKIASVTPPGVASFLLSAETEVAMAMVHHRKILPAVLQLQNHLTEGTYGDLRTYIPGIRIAQVVKVKGAAAIKEAETVHKKVDALLLDCEGSDLEEEGAPNLQEKWAICRKINDLSRVPVYLSGDLSPENVQEAIQTVQPFAVDVNRGVRTEGKLDAEKLAAFIKAVRGVQ